MPELPEVETTLQGILPHIKNQTIKKVIIRHPTLRWPIPKTLPQKLEHQKFSQLERRGKYILGTVGKGTLIIHLGMSGHLRVLKTLTPPAKHDHVDIEFANGRTLRFTDPRRFGAVLWTEDDPHTHPLIKHLGPEPFSNAFSGKYLTKTAQNKNLAIKSFIMDSKIVVGVGNIYATEALFFAGIHPTTPAKNISAEKMQLLAKGIKTILKHAITQGGTTLKDFLNSEGKAGYFITKLKVYGRDRLPCVKCKTLLKTMQINKRSTVYCEKCQKK